MKIIQPFTHGIHHAGYLVTCPGCGDIHAFNTEPWDRGKGEPGPVWKFLGTLDAPTFHPSLICRDRLRTSVHFPNRDLRWKKWREGEVFVPTVCHFYLKAGVFEFCSDSTHEHAGQHLPAIPWKD